MGPRIASGNGPRQVRISWRKRLLFLAVIWTGLFGLAEVAARVYIPLRGYALDEIREVYTRRRELRLTHTWADREQDHPYLPYLPRVQSPDVEFRGLRLTSSGEVKPRDVYRIFCLGGSTTYRGYPAKLQATLEARFAARGLRLEVVNASDVSYTSAESLIDFQFRCLPYQPDAVVVYHGVNDVWPAFGPEARPDYAHWRSRIRPNEPIAWDHLPRLLDASAAFVQLRSWFEDAEQPRTWKRAIMRYVPDFQNDPYHGVEPFRRNMTNLLAVARANGIPVLLATHVYNVEFDNERFLTALLDVNEVTRSLARPEEMIALVDAAQRIHGTYDTMEDVCHFRTDREGESQLVDLIAEGVLENLSNWLERNRPDHVIPDSYLAGAVGPIQSGTD